MNLPDPRSQPGPSLSDRVGLFTVLHARLLWILGLLALAGLVALGRWALR